MRSCHDLQTEARLPRRLSRFAFEREVSACAENCSCVWSASSVRGGIFSAPQHVCVLTDWDMTALTARVQGARQGELLRATPAPRSCGRKQVGDYKEFCLLILIRPETWVSSLGHCSTTPKSQHPTSQMGHPVMTPRLRLVSGGAHVPGPWQMLVIAARQSFLERVLLVVPWLWPAPSGSDSQSLWVTKVLWKGREALHSLPKSPLQSGEPGRKDFLERKRPR